MGTKIDRDSIINMDGDLRTKHLLLFWINLALMWLIMGLEMPIVNATIARLPNAKENLASFGVAFSIALIIEGPIIQFLSLAAAKSRCQKNYKMILKFAHILNFGLMGVHGIIAIPPIYYGLVEGVMNIPSDIAQQSWRPFLFMLFWTPAIGYRRLWQGILLAHNKSKYLPFTMAMRILAVTIGLIALVSINMFTGAEVAAIALSFSVCMGMVATALVVKKTVTIPQDPTIPLLSWKELLSFYIPLGISSFISMANRPVIAWGISLFPKTLESLATWPVVLSFVYLFQSLTSALQEMTIVLVKSPASQRIVHRFSLQLSIVISGFYLMVAFTPIGTWYMATVQGLSSELLPFTTLPLMILSFSPLLTGVICWLRGYNILRGNTRIVAIEGAIFVGGLFISFWGLMQVQTITGVTAAAIVTVIAMTCEIICLRFFGAKQRWLPL